MVASRFAYSYGKSKGNTLLQQKFLIARITTWFLSRQPYRL